jgi:hypothetical protein
MQSLSARRRVESGGRGDEEFWVRLAVGGWRVAVRGGHGWVRAEYKHDDAQEEAVDEYVIKELDEQDGSAPYDDAPHDRPPCHVEADELANESAAEAS